MAGQFIATGTTITFGGSSFIAKLLSLGPSQTRAEVQTSTMATTASHTYLPAKLVDRSLDIEIDYDPTDHPPIDEDIETITIVWSDTSTDNWVCTGFMTSHTVTATLEERVTASATIKISATPADGF